MSSAPEKAGQTLAKDAAARLLRWLGVAGSLDARRYQFGHLADELEDVLKQFENLDAIDNDVYKRLYRAQSNLMLALQTRPLSRPSCVKALRQLEAAATARAGVVAG
jgi:hypothetical protein